MNTEKDFRIELSDNISKELSASAFIEETKRVHKPNQDKKGIFSRVRKLSLTTILIFIMSLNRSLQRELDSFFKNINSLDYTIREITKGAFSQARAKVNPLGFKRLTQVAVDTFYRSAPYKTWHGLRLLASDGTRLMLPNHPSIKEEFGECSFGPKADSERSMAIGSMLYDVLNLLTIDASMSAYKNKAGKNDKGSSEQALLDEHLCYLQVDDLLLLDRGYASILLFYKIKAKGSNFCVRMKEGWWKAVRSFKESGEKEQIVTFSLPQKDRSKLKEHQALIDKPIECRLIRIELDSGETEILCTSLTDMTSYPYEEFKELYHLRWAEEEAYKLLKNRIELEDFSGKTAHAVKQDFYAKVFLLTLSAAYAYPIEDRVRQEFKAEGKRKHAQKINRTNAISMTQAVLISVFIKKQYERALKAFDEIVYRTREIIRPDRKFERNHRNKKQYSMNYKRL